MSDKERRLLILLQNNGIGPLIVEQFLFGSGEKQSSSIETLLALSPKSYNHDMEILAGNPKVVFLGTHLEVFGTMFEDRDGEDELDHARVELAKLKLRVKPETSIKIGS